MLRDHLVRLFFMFSYFSSVFKATVAITQYLKAAKK